MESQGREVVKTEEDYYNNLIYIVLIISISKWLVNLKYLVIDFCFRSFFYSFVLTDILIVRCFFLSIDPYTCIMGSFLMKICFIRLIFAWIFYLILWISIKSDSNTRESVYLNV